MPKIFTISTALAICASATIANAAPIPANAAPPIDFSYVVSGSTNNWTYDISVTNHFGPGLEIYLFGVALPSPTVSEASGHFVTGYWKNWSNESMGGTSTNYNVNWLNSDIFFSTLKDGETVHFLVGDSSATALAKISWYTGAASEAESAEYSGIYNIGTGYDPFVEGVNSQFIRPAWAVPEPETYTMLFIGLITVGLSVSRKRKTTP